MGEDHASQVEVGQVAVLSGEIGVLSRMVSTLRTGVLPHLNIRGGGEYILSVLLVDMDPV